MTKPIIALGLNLRYEPTSDPMVIIIHFDFLAWMTGIIPLHKYLLRSFYNAIITELWLEEVSRVATLAVHDREPLP